MLAILEGPTDISTYIFPIIREELFMFLPRDGVVAEVGVLEGGLSQHILTVATPQRLHLVDLWECQADRDYALDPSNGTPELQNVRLDGVKKRFADQISSGQVVLNRGYSHVIAESFPSNYFDWVFIDANHTYEAVLTDLRAYGAKLKEDGLIVGHDFTNQRYAQECKFGVVEAVKQYCRESGFVPVALTGRDQFPTYVLARRSHARQAQILMFSLFRTVRGIVEIRNFLDRDFRHETVRFSDEMQNFIISV